MQAYLDFILQTRLLSFFLFSLFSDSEERPDLNHIFKMEKMRYHNES